MMELEHLKHLEQEGVARSAKRNVVGSYGSYVDAREAIDSLYYGMFPVERLSIVAEVQRSWEPVPGLLGYVRAAVRGARYGAPPGAAAGLGLGLLGPATPVASGLVLLIAGAAFGAMIWALVELGAYAVSDGEAALYTDGVLRADRYEITADEEIAEWAERLLGGCQSSPGSAEGNTDQTK